MELAFNSNIDKIFKQTEYLNNEERELLIWALLEKEKKSDSYHFQQIKIANKWVFLFELPEKFQTDNTSFAKNKPVFGSMKGFVKYMAPDFNEPISDFKDYM